MLGSMPREVSVKVQGFCAVFFIMSIWIEVRKTNAWCGFLFIFFCADLAFNEHYPAHIELKNILFYLALYYLVVAAWYKSFIGLIRMASCLWEGFICYCKLMVARQQRRLNFCFHRHADYRGDLVKYFDIAYDSVNINCRPLGTLCPSICILGWDITPTHRVGSHLY